MKKLNLFQAKIFLTLLILVFVAYWDSWNGFFQQDEWAGLGNFYSLQGLPPLTLIKEMYAPMFGQGVGHLLPWTPLVNYARYTVFGLNYPPYVILSLLLRAASAFLVFLLALRLSKDKLVAYAAAVFFSIAASASQAVTWVGTSLPTQLAAIFSLLTIIFWLDWLEGKRRSKLLASIATFVLAIGFKETALFLFIFLPVLGFLKRPELDRRVFFLFAALATAYAGLRLAVAGLSGTFILFNSAAQNLLTVSLRGATQTLFSAELILRGTDKIVQFISPEGIPLKGEHLYDVFLEEGVVRPLMTLFGLGLILVYAWWAKLDKQRRPIILTSLLLLLTAFAPLAFNTTGELSATFLPPRGLYVPAIGFSLLLGLTFVALLKTRYKRIVVFSLAVLFLGTHAFFLREQTKQLVRVGMERKAILTEIKGKHTDLPDKIVFYTKSNRAYYGLPPEENIMPFQSGFGQTLLVWYYPTERWPREFLQDRFLWEITAQGYKEAGGRGFGYFRDLELLKKTRARYNIHPDSIIAFDWDSEEEVLTDITEKIRNELR